LRVTFKLSTAVFGVVEILLESKTDLEATTLALLIISVAVLLKTIYQVINDDSIATSNSNNKV